MRVSVSSQQCHLEEHHARGPNRGRSSKPRQEELADNELNLEKKKRGDKGGYGIAHIIHGTTIAPDKT